MFPPLAQLIDLVFPPTCLACDAAVETVQALCASCWSRLTFLGAAGCEACAHPFEFAVPDGTLCGACARTRPPFARARAALVYDEASRDLVLGFKHHDHTERTVLFAKWMAGAGRDVVAGADVIVPVPLHWTRLWSRRYNQAALLALAIGKRTGTQVLVDALVRSRKTVSQGHLGRDARARNVQGAFAVAPRWREHLHGKRVLLVDDVYTTGATLGAVSGVLKRAGCGDVDILVLTRVVRGFV